MNEEFRPRLYRALARLARWLSFLFFFPRVEGLENVPADGPVILCANHIALADPVLLGVLVRRPISFIAKKELFRGRWLGRFLRRLGAFPVGRGEADIGAVRNCLGLLKNGQCLGIFAQGTRRRKSMDEPAMNTGVALIAVRSGAPVVPVHIRPYHVFGRVRIYFGRPLDFSGVTRADSGVLAETTERIRQSIFALGAPEAPRGE